MKDALWLAVTVVLPIVAALTAGLLFQVRRARRAERRLDYVRRCYEHPERYIERPFVVNEDDLPHTRIREMIQVSVASCDTKEALWYAEKLLTWSGQDMKVAKTIIFVDAKKAPKVISFLQPVIRNLAPID